MLRNHVGGVGQTAKIQVAQTFHAVLHSLNGRDCFFAGIHVAKAESINLEDHAEKAGNQHGRYKHLNNGGGGTGTMLAL